MLKYANARLLVRDFPASFSFYRDVLGFAPVLGGETDVYAEFEVGEAILALFPRSFMAGVLGTAGKPAASDGQDAMALVFAVEDVDQSYAELGARGVAFLTAPEDRPDWGIRTAHFRDPDGNLLEIYSPLCRTPANAPSPTPPGPCGRGAERPSPEAMSTRNISSSGTGGLLTVKAICAPSGDQRRDVICAAAEHRPAPAGLSGPGRTVRGDVVEPNECRASRRHEGDPVAVRATERKGGGRAEA